MAFVAVFRNEQNKISMLGDWVCRVELRCNAYLNMLESRGRSVRRPGEAPGSIAAIGYEADDAEYDNKL